ncbi:MAG: peptidyl-prolyl cis-trans isomerase [Halanaerobiales bacterium]|nr:peptidyl-prolyl cis-trans isomerase [Halanaerobiales bacterium]
MNFKSKLLILTVIMLMVFSIPIMAQDNSEVSEAVNEGTPEFAAVVNGEEISMQELEEFAGVRNVLMQILQSNQEFGTVLIQSEAGQDLINEFRRYKLEQLVTSELLIQEAKNRGIEVSEEERNEIFNQQVTALQQQNDLNDEQFERAIQQQGFESLSQYKEVFMENNMDGFIVNKLRDEVVSESSVSDAEAEKYYNENISQFEVEEQKKVSHILFDEKAKAEEVLAEIEAGADFAEMAREHSTGPTADNGGDLGFISPNEQRFDSTFRNAAMQLDVGEVIDEPVKTQFGYHIIKVTDKQEAETKEFSEVKEQIKNQLQSQKENQAWSEFVQQLRKDADIKINL